jgi:hypothetical protein
MNRRRAYCSSGEADSMQRVVAGASISLDGYSAGPNVSISNPMRDGGSLLHEWIFQADGADRELIEHNRSPKLTCIPGFTA